MKLNKVCANTTRLCLRLVAFSVLCMSGSGHAGSGDAVDGPFRFAGRTEIDTAFEHVTSGNNIYNPIVDWKSNMPDGFQGMRSSSYPWATTTYGDSELWMGTISSGWCV
ncbi:MAG: hypothetical protein ACKVK6_13925, partial [bacterium]